jgi:Icc-related predicted phosphoesterase
MIEEMAAKIPDMSKAIFNFHDPPKDSTLDTCPMLDWDKDPPEQIVRGGQPVMHGAGSSAVREAIEKYQADARSARSHPRVAVRCEDRTHNLHQPRQ